MNMEIATVLLVMQAVQACIAAAPGVADIVVKAKDLISSLFTAQLITKAQQDALHAHVEAHAALVAAGIVPPHWSVEADPV